MQNKEEFEEFNKPSIEVRCGEPDGKPTMDAIEFIIQLDLEWRSHHGLLFD